MATMRQSSVSFVTGPLGRARALACAALLLGGASSGCAIHGSSAKTLSLRAASARDAGEQGAAPTGEARAAIVTRMEDPELSSIPVEGSSLTKSRARVMVYAPLERVRAVLFDFPHYAEFVPHYRSARIFGKTARGGDDVVMEMEALGGMMRFWARVEIEKPVIEGPSETYKIRLITGSVRSFKASWQLEAVSAGATRLTIESLVEPNIPLPSAFINEGSLDGAGESILSLKKRAESAPR
jgi:ribosome-associated toxin RatA of RatAB toxin-antitoxin module